MGSEGGEPSGSIEVWLKPRRIWDNATFLSFYTAGHPYQFSLRQFDGGLELRAEIQNDPHPAKNAIVYLKNTFRRSGPVFLTITSGINGTLIYVDGAQAEAARNLQISVRDLTGRIVVGDSPGQSDSWSGELRGLAIYRGELTPGQVLRHYQTWTDEGRPETRADERNLALYLLSDRTGRIVHDGAGSGVNLYIPEKYTVLDQIFLRALLERIQHIPELLVRRREERYRVHTFRLLLLRLLVRAQSKVGGDCHGDSGNLDQRDHRGPAGVPSDARLWHDGHIHQYARDLDWNDDLQEAQSRSQGEVSLAASSVIAIPPALPNRDNGQTLRIQTNRIADRVACRRRNLRCLDQFRNLRLRR